MVSDPAEHLTARLPRTGWLRDITHASGLNVLASYQYKYDKVANRTQAVEQVLAPFGPFEPATETEPPALPR